MQRHRPAHPVQHRRLRRARPDNGRSVRPQVHPAVRQGRGVPLCRATLCTPTTCRRVRTAATAQRRACSRWRAAVNELADTSWAWTRSRSVQTQHCRTRAMIMPAYYGQLNTSCALDRCLATRARHDRLGQQVPRAATWETVRCVLSAWAWPCRARASTSVDVGSATLKINDDGLLYPAPSARRTWAPAAIPSLAQIAAEVLECPLDNIAVLGADTDCVAL